ncbi:MAG: polysaccharide deacetylase family protein [Desulfobacteraceae bacterium]|jgi:peptidoglycan/xylan/chitin deacetylase (PgdA/CDA1 family)
MELNNHYRLVTLFLLWMLGTAGCNPQFLDRSPEPAPAETRHFVMVTAKSGDTLAALAGTYLNDPEKAWQIAAYNRIESLTQGQQIVIPRVPLRYGGIEQNGFQTVPVLLYTALSNDPSNSKAVHARDFDRQMQYLNENGYATVSLDQFHAFLTLKDQLPPDAVIVSFDTTRPWVYEIAFPILRQRGMKAALFIRLNDIGAKGRLTWAQLAEMSSGGFEIGVYSSPIKVPAREDLKQYFETFDKAMAEPKNAFKTHLKKPCRYFSYGRLPSNDLTIAMLKKHGYRAAFTRKRGANPFFVDNFKIKRSIIYSNYNMDQFRQNLVTFRSAELR